MVKFATNFCSCAVDQEKARRPASPGVLQEGARDARAKTFGFRVSTFTPPREGPVRAPWWRQSPSFTWAP